MRGLKLVLVVGVLGYMGWAATRPHRVTVRPFGNGLVFEHKNWKTDTQTEANGEITGSFLVVGAQEAQAPFAEGTVSVIPMTEVPALEKKFGNFLHCENDNQFVANDKVIDMFFVPTSAQVRTAFGRVLKLIHNKNFRPVVQMTAQMQRIRSIASGGTEVNLSGVTHLYLLKDLRVEREDYRTPGFENDRGRRIFKAMMLF